MLADYYSIQIDVEAKTLTGMPVVHEEFKPYPHELPNFILRLATEPDYSSEIESIATICVELSHYFARLIDVFATKVETHHGKLDAATQAVVDELKDAYAQTIFPEMRKYLAVRSRFGHEKHDLTFAMVTCTENLYKVFERC